MADFSAVPFPTPASPLVGREREQAALRDALAVALAGRGSLVLIGGEAGIGKTTLAEALLTEATDRGALVLVGRCYDLSETPPYGPWGEAIARAPRGRDWPASPDLAGAGATSQAALFAAARDYLVTLAAQRPLVLLLDDLHWADPASLDLLRVLARQLADLPLLLLAIYRNDELTRRHPFYQLLPTLEREARAARLDLRPLGEAAMRALVGRYVMPDSESARLVAWLVGRAEGNAFFTAQLLRALEEGGVLQPADGGWRLGDLAAVGLPAPLRQVLDARLARLGTETLRLFTLAAVVGQEVPLALWATVAEVDDDALLDAIDAAEEANLVAVAPDGAAVRFAHALIREALYEGLVATRRRRVHRRVGEALAVTASPDPDMVAYHFRLAGDARAVPWLVAAGERAIGAFAWLTAAERYEAAIALLGEGEATAGERGWLLYRLGRMRRFTHLRRARGHFEEARRLAEVAGDRALAASVRFDLGTLGLRLGELSRGLADLAAGVAALEALPPAGPGPLARLDAIGDAVDTRARRGSLAIWLALAGRYAEALPMAARFLATTPAPAPSGGRGASAYADAQYGLGMALAMLGRPGEARAAFALAREAYGTVEHFFLLGDAAVAELQHLQLAYWPEWPEERERLAREGERAIARVVDAGITQLAPAYGRLPLLVLTGRWAEARAVAQSVPRDNARTAQFGASLLGPIERARGERAAAWARVRAALSQGPATEPGEAFMPEALLFQRLAALLALDDGDLPSARAWLAAHDRWLAWSGAVLGQAEGALGWANYHRAAGDLGLARAGADEALVLATEPRRPLALLAAHRTLGEFDTASECTAAAATHLEAALALAEACEAPYERALTLLALGDLHAATGRWARVESTLAAARALLEPLGARPALARADALAARLAAVPATPPHASPFGLTPRETDVLRLLAEGLTDQRIAERLFVSRSTVNGHTRAIYGKLGVTSRAAATRLALDYGLR